MSEQPSFEELMRRVRAGDQEAASQLVRHYEPTIRRIVRVRLGGSPLNARLDSMDVCQSVLASFFLRAAAGQYELAGPDDLVKLLAVMARSKLAQQARRQQAQRRDIRRQAAGGSDVQHVAAPASTPSEQIAAKDLLEAAQRRLSPAELQLVELRQQGIEWGEIAARQGGTPEALRKQLTRALDRVAQELGLDSAP